MARLTKLELAEIKITLESCKNAIEALFILKKKYGWGDIPEYRDLLDDIYKKLEYFRD